MQTNEQHIRERLKLLRNVKYCNPSINDLIIQAEKLDRISVKEDFLGSILESLNDRRKRKKLGQFYTPLPIVEYIVDNVGVTPESRILDLSCGSGSFLIAAFEKLKTLSNRSSGSILSDNIYGVDLDETSTKICQINLWLRSDLCLKELQNLERNIKCGNSIVSNLAIDREKALDWREEFKGVMDRGGFDVAIGNPPYVTLKKGEDLDPNESVYARITRGQVNAATLMIGRALEILKIGGTLGFLLPKSILRVNSYKNLRNYLLENTYIRNITDLGLMFREVRGEQFVLIVKKGGRKIPKNNSVMITIYRNKKKRIDEQHSSKISQRLLAKFDNFLVLDEKRLYDLALKLSNHYKTLSYYCDGEIFRGLCIGANSKLINENKIEDFEVVLRGDSIGKYTIRYPLYIDIARLDSKFHSKIRRLRQKKIVLQNIFSSESGVISTYDNDKLLTLDTVTNIVVKRKIDPKYLLALLNSNVVNFFLIFVIYNRSKLTMHADKIYLRQIPIVAAPHREQSSLHNFVDEMIDLHKQLQRSKQNVKKQEIMRRIKPINSLMNTKIYKLYRLNSEDVKLIEDSLKTHWGRDLYD